MKKKGEHTVAKTKQKRSRGDLGVTRYAMRMRLLNAVGSDWIVSYRVYDEMRMWEISPNEKNRFFCNTVEGIIADRLCIA